MALDFQIIQFPLNAGADTSSEDGTSVEPRELINLNFDKSGAPVKRRGFETLASSRLTRLAASLTGSLTASTRPWNDTSRLIDNGGELLRLNGTELDSFVSGAQSWSFRDHWPSALVYTDQVDAGAVTHVDADVASFPTLGRTLRTWTTIDNQERQDGRGRKASVWAEVVDDASGATVVKRYLLDYRYVPQSGSWRPRSSRCFGIKDGSGNQWGVVMWQTDGLSTGSYVARNLAYTSFNISNPNVSLGSAAFTSFYSDYDGQEGVKFDVSCEPDLNGVYPQTASLVGVTEGLGNRRLGHTALTISSNGTITGPATNVSDIPSNPAHINITQPVVWSNGKRAYAAYGTFDPTASPPKFDVRGATYDFSNWVAHSLLTTHTGVLNFALRPELAGICPSPTWNDNATYPATASVLFNSLTTQGNAYGAAEAAWWGEMPLSGWSTTTRYGGVRRQDGVFWTSAPFAATETSSSQSRRHAYAWVGNRPKPYPPYSYGYGSRFADPVTTAFLVEVSPLGGSSGSNQDPLRLVATAMPRYAVTLSGSTYSRFASSSVGYTAMLHSSGSAAQMTSLVQTNVRFDQAPTFAITRNGVVCGGGVPWIYDGVEAAELGFVSEPDVFLGTYKNVGTTADDSAQPPYSTVFYRAVWEWTDAKGNLHQSIPSAPIMVKNDAGAFYQQNVFFGYELPLTMKGTTWGTRALQLRETSRPQMQLYRTTTNGATYYKVPRATYVYGISYPYVGQGGIDSSTPQNQQYVAFVDRSPDYILTGSTNNVPLYTEGDALDNVIPPSSRFVSEWKGCIVLAGTPDDSIWFSKPLEEGTAPGFNDTLVQPAFEGGRVKAISPMDSNLVILKQRSIWAITGEPPDNLGNSSLSAPQKLIEGLGCIDPMSVVQTPDGVMFRSDRGIVLLNRSLSIEPVGEPVRDQLQGTLVSAHVDTERGLVRFFQDSPPRIFDFHREVSTRVQKSTWTVQELRDVDVLSTSNFSLTRPRASTLWAGKTVWAGASGSVYLESDSVKYDSGSFDGSPSNSQHFVTGTFTSAIMRPVGNALGNARFRKVMFRGDQVSQAGIVMRVTSSWSPETVQWTAGEVNGLVDQGLGEFQVSFKPANQKASSIRVSISDIAPTGSLGTGEGYLPKSIAVDVGAKRDTEKKQDAGKK